ncbi:hypothetical protein D3C87_1244420 [compost metagenome]
MVQAVKQPDTHQERNTDQRCAGLQNKDNREDRQDNGQPGFNPSTRPEPEWQRQCQRTQQPDTGIDDVLQARWQQRYPRPDGIFTSHPAIERTTEDVQRQDPELRSNKPWATEKLRITESTDHHDKHHHVEDMLEELQLSGNRSRHQEPQNECHPPQRQRLIEQTRTTLLDQEHQARQYHQSIEQIVGPLRGPADDKAQQEQAKRCSEVS